MSTGLRATIQELSEDIHREVVVHRRHLHAHPELSFEENETAEYISEALSALGIHHKRTGDTGITGFIKGKKSRNDTVALRADIDALPQWLPSLGAGGRLPGKGTGSEHCCCNREDWQPTGQGRNRATAAN